MEYSSEIKRNKLLKNGIMSLNLKIVVLNERRTSSPQNLDTGNGLHTCNPSYSRDGDQEY
jgi:hypothetical protein